MNLYFVNIHSALRREQGETQKQVLFQQNLE